MNMKSIFTELLISYHRWRMTHSTCRNCQLKHMLAMCNYIKSRREAQIARMERARGLR
jgi:hypothetical protein